MYKKEETKSKKNCKDQLLNINSFFKKIKKFLRWFLVWQKDFNINTKVMLTRYRTLKIRNYVYYENFEGR